MNKKKWIIGALAAIVVIVVACAVPYLFMGAPVEGLVKVRKGSTIDMIGDSVKAHVDESFASRVVTMLSLMGAEVENREGAFRIKSGMSPFTAARRIKNGVQDGLRPFVQFDPVSFGYRRIVAIETEEDELVGGGGHMVGITAYAIA